MRLNHLIFVLTAVLLVFNPLHAHELRPAVADIVLSTNNGNPTAFVTLRANLERLMAEIGPEHDDSDTSPNRVRYDSLRALSSEMLGKEFTKFKPVFSRALNVKNTSGQRINLLNLNAMIPETGDKTLPRDTIVTFDLDLQQDDDAFSWQWQESFGEVIVRADNIADQHEFSVMLSPGQRSEPITLGTLTPLSLLATVSNYIVIGFEHIIPKGLDHILFVIGLFLLSSRIKPLLYQVTAFTAAHTLTLLLGTLNIVQIPGSIVEPLIAASIVFVSIDYLFLSLRAGYRLIIIFLFGLLHGLGFAGVLGEVGLSVQYFFAALLSFNIGVELGQICVLTVCFLVLGYFTTKPWYRRYLGAPAALIIGTIGFFWFLQRTVL